MSGMEWKASSIEVGSRSILLMSTSYGLHLAAKHYNDDTYLYTILLVPLMSEASFGLDDLHGLLISFAPYVNSYLTIMRGRLLTLARTEARSDL